MATLWPVVTPDRSVCSVCSGSSSSSSPDPRVSASDSPGAFDSSWVLPKLRRRSFPHVNTLIALDLVGGVLRRRRPGRIVNERQPLHLILRTLVGEMIIVPDHPAVMMASPSHRTALSRPRSYVCPYPDIQTRGRPQARVRESAATGRVLFLPRPVFERSHIIEWSGRYRRRPIVTLYYFKSSPMMKIVPHGLTVCVLLSG